MCDSLKEWFRQKNSHLQTFTETSHQPGLEEVLQQVVVIIEPLGPDEIGIDFLANPRRIWVANFLVIQIKYFKYFLN